jgi:hypothetical protein
MARVERDCEMTAAESSASELIKFADGDAGVRQHLTDPEIVSLCEWSPDDH